MAYSMRRPARNARLPAAEGDPMPTLPSPPESTDFTAWPRALSRVMTRITANADRQDVFTALATGLVDEFGVDLAQIWLYEPADDALYVRAVAGYTTGEATPSERLSLRTGTPDSRALLANAPVVLDPIGPDDGFAAFDDIR